MANIIIFIIILLFLITVFAATGIYFHRHPGEPGLDKDPYLDEKGNHEYYDRHILRRKKKR